MEATAMGSEAEIAARLERATRSGLASSSLASYSYSQASLTNDRPPTLEELLHHLGPPNAPRCPACRTSLTFGSRSRICLACATPVVLFSPPSFTSSLAFRCFSETLHIDGLETNSGKAEEEVCSDPELDFATKSSTSLSLPLKVSGQKVSSHAESLSDQGKPNIEPETLKSDVHIPLPSSGDQGSMTLSKPMDHTTVDLQKHASILDYSANLEGISLEDFFSNQVKSRAPPAATNSDMLSKKFSAGIDTSSMSVVKESLLWDTSVESIISDGFDLIANTSDSNTNKVVGVEDDDDPFSSWEGDFQSAMPAPAFVSDASSSQTHGPELSADPVMSRNIEDLFGDFSNMNSIAESGGIQGNTSWVNNGNVFGSNTDTENTFKTDTQRSMDDDNLFGSGWQQNLLHPLVSSLSESQSPSCVNIQSELAKSSQEGDLLGLHFSKQMEAPIGNHSLASAGEFTSTEFFPMERPTSASVSAGKKSQIVGSLLAQLHDLSFLLADKLVVRTEGKNTKPDPSS